MLDGLARGAGPRRELLLRERQRDLDPVAFALAEALAQLDEPLRHAADHVVGRELRITVGGEQADQADVLTYRGGELVKFQTAGDTALYERVFGSK